MSCFLTQNVLKCVVDPKRRRYECTAVVIENNIIVLGGSNESGKRKSVEPFNFERYTWEELPEMSRAVCLHTSVVVLTI